MQNCRRRNGNLYLSILDDVIATVINCRVASITHLPSFCSHTTHKYGRTEKKKKTGRDSTGGAGELYKWKLKQKTDINKYLQEHQKQTKTTTENTKKKAKQIPIYSLSLKPARPPRSSSARPPLLHLPRTADSLHASRISQHTGQKKESEINQSPSSFTASPAPASSSPEGRNFPISAARDRTESRPGFATVRREPWGRRSEALIRGRRAAAVVRAGNALPQAAGRRGLRVPAGGGGGCGAVICGCGGC